MDNIAFVPPAVLRFRFQRAPCSFNQRNAVLFKSSRIAAIPSQNRRKFTMSTTEDPITNRVRNELAEEGVDFDNLLNASKVVGLTVKLERLNGEASELAIDSDERKVIESQIAGVEKSLLKEKRQVMQLWLKRLFLGQALVFIAVGGVLSNNALPGNYEVPLVGQALGFWTTWLFTIPALRARKGTSKSEKSALNAAFLITPLVNVAMPTVTKNCGQIWAVDVLVLASCYLYYKTIAASSGDDSDADKEKGKVTGILKFLDWGSWR